jgi:Cupin
MHWHPNADEGQYWISGSGLMGVFVTGQNIRTKDFHAGDVGYVSRSMGHYIENTGDNDVVFLEIFRSSYYSSISFTQRLSHLPPELVKAHFSFSDDVLARLPTSVTDQCGRPSSRRASLRAHRFAMKDTILVVKTGTSAPRRRRRSAVSRGRKAYKSPGRRTRKVCRHWGEHGESEWPWLWER